MIPDIAVIIAAYAVARLANEYVLDPTNEEQQVIRLVLAIVAIGVIGFFLYDVIQKSNSASTGLGGLGL